jgi:hypothetical protein
LREGRHFFGGVNDGYLMAALNQLMRQYPCASANIYDVETPFTGEGVHTMDNLLMIVELERSHKSIVPMIINVK